MLSIIATILCIYLGLLLLGVLVEFINSVCRETWAAVKFVAYTIGDRVLTFFGK